MSIRRVVLVEYFVAADTILIFGVREDFDEPQVVELKMSRDETLKFVTDNFGAQDGASKASSLNLDEWQVRFGQLIEPLSSWTAEGDLVWIVPHDVLHYLPLHALKIQGRYLIERNPVCYSPSASIMKHCRDRHKGRREKALVLGDSCSDLPNAREEAYTVSKIFNTTPYTNLEATKSLVKERLEEQRDDLDILHFACHSYFRSGQPLKSGITLAPENLEPTSGRHGEQWNLTVEEIFTLSMHADLVTLSSCNSGINKNSPGDELMGLARAFIYAGSASVIVSLWSVEDVSTRILMERFYQELRMGTTKAEALQRAQVHVMNMTSGDSDERSFRDPYYWAPFLLVGDWD